MKGKVVLDSSAIVALFFQEDVSERVEEVVEKYSEYYTVSQAYSEVANAAWKRVRIYGEDEGLSKQALEKAVEFMDRVCRVEDSKILLNSAFEIALKNGITVYDALFIALAMKLNEKLVTTDRKLYDRIKKTELVKFVKCV
ncbi:MAG: PIN domain-containing protein [Archaeoglobales archaeon]|nr:MAG: PIN domain-containing protein [Archaeoglobales archaeon]